MFAQGGKRIDPQRVADLVRDAGGKIVGRTRLQKIAFLLECAGVGDGFEFSYRNYGPFSDELWGSAERAKRLDLLVETESETSWGGRYSVFTADGKPSRTGSKLRKEIIAAALECNAVALELAATALFLQSEGVPSPWEETSRRKPEKALSNLSNAKQFYDKLRTISTPKRFPAI